MLQKEFPVIFEMALVNKERIMRRRMLIETCGQKDRGTEVHRLSPEGGEELALDAEMFDVLGVLRRLDRWNFLVQQDADGRGGSRIDMQEQRPVVEIPRLHVPFLAFAAFGRELDGVTVGAMKGFIGVEHRLHVVITGRELGKASEWIAEGRRVDDGRSIGLPVVDIETEELGAECGFFAELEAWLGRAVSGDAEKNVAIEGLSVGDR